MLLTLDIGNTEITLGLFAGGDLEAHWRMTTNPDRTPDEWGSAVGAFLVQAGHSPNEVRAVCLASVAPAVTQSVVEGIARSTGRTGVAVDSRTLSGSRVRRSKSVPVERYGRRARTTILRGTFCCRAGSTKLSPSTRRRGKFAHARMPS